MFCFFVLKGEIPEIEIDEEKYEKKLKAILKPFENIFDCLGGKADKLRSLMSGEFFEPEAMSDSNAQGVTNDLKNKLSSFGNLITSTQTDLAKFDFGFNRRSARRKRDATVPKVIDDVDEALRSLMTVEGLILYLLEHTDLEIVTIYGVAHVKICVDTDLGCKEFIIKSELIAEILEVLKSVDPCLKEVLEAINTAKRALVELKNTIKDAIWDFLKKGSIWIKNGVIYVGGEPVKTAIDKSCSFVSSGWSCVTGWYDDIKDYIFDPEPPKTVPKNEGDFSYNCPCKNDETTTPEESTTTPELDDGYPPPEPSSEGPSEPSSEGPSEPSSEGPSEPSSEGPSESSSEPSSTTSGYRWKCV